MSTLFLDNSLPSPHIQFEILLYRYKKKHGKRAISKLIETYSFDTRHKDVKASYYITVRDLEEAYKAEKIKLEIEEQTELLATLLFQKYKGFGVIDTIREMDIRRMHQFSYLII